MLVLSRRLNEKILFAGMSVSVEVVAIKPGAVRLGIEAPREITVLREEVPDRVTEWGQPAPSKAANDERGLRTENRLLRNRLRTCNADLKVLRRQLRLGLVDEAESTLDKIQADFQLLRQ